MRRFLFRSRYQTALQLVAQNVRTFPTTSAGRLFDTAAALLGFTREITFEGQAAMWVEHLARSAGEAKIVIRFRLSTESWISGRCCGRLRWTD